MSEIVRVFIATDARAMRRAEVALEFSIRRLCSANVAIVFMDKFRNDEVWHEWNDEKWYTPFSNFRFSVPEVSGFEGRSIYVDVDQLFLRDPLELLNLEIPKDKGFLALGPYRSDVMVYDNSKFKGDWWPSLQELKSSVNHVGQHLAKMEHLWAPLPLEWCCNDGGVTNSNQGNKFQTAPYKEGETCLVHYTEMNWQPWKPYPKKFSYPNHPHQEVARVWWETYALALEEKLNEN